MSIDLQARVRGAALLLDKLKPDWFTCIDPNTLNLERDDQCICGQSGLEWKELIYQHHDALKGVMSDRMYEPYWLEEIASRIGDPIPSKEPFIPLVNR